ncbi:hypothetical protein M514_25327 [Trichuris suis]|uniref:Uncharacterized protein n=1 Tax=Trichuris suis TaxID=68888 RepID=A0A085MZ31_9BILA|nr:hypothetical protein M514_25327 [Trichuris suis]
MISKGKVVEYHFRHSLELESCRYEIKHHPCPVFGVWVLPANKRLNGTKIHPLSFLITITINTEVEETMRLMSKALLLIVKVLIVRVKGLPSHRETDNNDWNA